MARAVPLGGATLLAARRVEGRVLLGPNVAQCRGRKQQAALRWQHWRPGFTAQAAVPVAPCGSSSSALHSSSAKVLPAPTEEVHHGSIPPAAACHCGPALDSARV